MLFTVTLCLILSNSSHETLLRMINQWFSQFSCSLSALSRRSPAAGDCSQETEWGGARRLGHTRWSRDIIILRFSGLTDTFLIIIICCWDTSQANLETLENYLRIFIWSSRIIMLFIKNSKNVLIHELDHPPVKEDWLCLLYLGKSCSFVRLFFWISDINLLRLE